ncbi:MAG TPA: hypothetical protein VGH20_07035, partial [Myxococcales bacterium]
MCLKKDRHPQGCKWLDADPSKWSKATLLSAIPAVDAGFEHFRQAVEFAATGCLAAAQRELDSIEESELRDWYVEHAQVAGIRRFEIRAKNGTQREGVVGQPRAKLKYPSRATEQRIFERDAYTCVYCGIGVVSRRLLHAFSKVVGTAFPMETTNATTHGAALVYRAVADHVEP